MNNKGFAISIIMYSLVFVVISIFYILLGILKTRYTVTSNLKESIMEQLNESNILYDKIAKLGDVGSTPYIKKYNETLGEAIDTYDGTGTKDVYYYTGSEALSNGNAIFGRYCWQIVRTTKTGGVKLIYNGLKTSDNKCPNNNSLRPQSNGVVGSNGVVRTNLSGSKIYGTSFQIYESGSVSFKLENTHSYSWSDSTYQDIIGKFVCGTDSGPTGGTSSCTVLYYVGQYQSNTEASTTKFTIATNNHYSYVGISAFNAFSDSPALVGYKYGDVYKYGTKSMPTDTKDIINHAYVGGTDYYYGDSAVWVNNHYELKMNGVTPTTTSSWSSIRDHAQGMYTCKSYTDTSCTTVYYIVANSTDNYINSIPLSNNENGETKSITLTFGTGFSESGGTYSLTGTRTVSFLLKDWYTTYNNSNYKNVYICDNLTSSTCTNEVYYIYNTSNYDLKINKSSQNFVYANDVEYVGGKYKLILNDATNKPYQSIWDWYKKYNTITNTHYTCFDNYDKTNNSCGDSIYFIHYTDNDEAFYFELKNGDKIETALQNMFNTSNSTSSNVNRYNSAIKGVVDSWYQDNLEAYEEYLDLDAVYCNDRSIKKLGGWSPKGNIVSNYDLEFLRPSSLTCDKVTDRFSYNNVTSAKLEHPIGLLTYAEYSLMSGDYANTSISSWFMTPSNFSWYAAHSYGISTNGTSMTNNVNATNSVRPVVVIKEGIGVIRGNGSYDEPYILDIPEPSN